MRVYYGQNKSGLRNHILAQLRKYVASKRRSMSDIEICDREIERLHQDLRELAEEERTRKSGNMRRVV